MKKNLKLKILSICLAIIIFIVIGAFFYIKYSEKTLKKNKSLIENLIDNNLLENYTPLLVDFSNEKSKIAYILGPKNHSLILVQGPLIKNKDDRQKLILSLQPGLQKSNKTSYNQIVEITTEGSMWVHDKTYPLYTLNIKSKNKNTAGNAIFIDDEDKTFLLISLAQKKDYDGNIAKDFLENIKFKNN